jgi:hypothetical protein
MKNDFRVSRKWILLKEKWENAPKKSRKFSRRIERRLNAFLRLSTHKSTNKHHIDKKAIKYIQKSKLMLTKFIQIIKSFILFSVFYSQPKIEILGCDKLPRLT